VSLPTPAILSALYQRLASDPAGAAARATLPGGVFTADAFLTPLSGAVQVPDGAFALWRSGVVTGESGNIRRTTGAWWVYAAQGQEYQIATAIAAIEAAYPRDAVAYGLTTIGPIGQSFYDSTLGVSGRAVTVNYTRRA
jgi:hypothetical protein